MAKRFYEETPGFAYRSPVGVGSENFYMGDLAGFYILANKEGAGNVEIDCELHGDLDYLYQIYPTDKGLRVRILHPKGDDVSQIGDMEGLKLCDVGYLKDLIKKYVK